MLLAAAALAVQVGYWLLIGAGFARVRRAAEARDETDPAAPLLPLSVVVAARDEAARLGTLLDALAAQTHPEFEVVIVDDRSTDATADLVRERAAEDWRFRLVQVPEGGSTNLPPKKHALTRGILAARHDRLAFTDADCVPPPEWLHRLAEAAQADPEAVLVGYSPYEPATGILNAFVRYETLLTALFAAAGIGWGRPLWAVGRNLSYPRALFDAVGGFAHSAASLSGDDDLLVQEVARRDLAPVRYVLDTRTFVPSEPPRTLGAWARQKLRHTSAGGHYRPGVKAHLLAFHGSNLLVWLAAPVLAVLGTPIGLGMLAARLLVQRFVLKEAWTAFEAPDLSPAQPALDALYLLYNTLWAPLGVVFTPRSWRSGR